MKLRNRLKNLLLSLEKEDLDFLLEIAKKYSWSNRHKNDKHYKFDDFACDICDEYGLNGLYQFQESCFDELGYMFNYRKILGFCK